MLPEDAEFAAEFNNGNNNKYGQGIWAIFYKADQNIKNNMPIDNGMTRQELNSKDITNGKPFNESKQGKLNVSAVELADLKTDLGDLKNYYLQHIYKDVKGKPAHGDFGTLYAYNFSSGQWETVTNFEKGKDNKGFVTNQNVMLKGYTCMADMGSVDAAKSLLQWDFKKTNDISSDYRILKIEGDYYIGLEVGDNSDHADWIIRISKAESGVSPAKTQARIFCEDMGDMGDFDFNDVVFDAVLEDNNDISITVLAFGATYDISIDGVPVTMGKMTNTGENEASLQKFTIKAVNGACKYANLGDIPVTVNPGGNAQPYSLDAPIGGAPQKIATYINVNWADEYVSIERAYNGFKSWVNSAQPDTWANNENALLTDLDLTNNN